MLCIVSKYHPQDIKKRKKQNIPVTPHHAARRVEWCLKPSSDELFSRHRMRMTSRPPGPEVQIWVAPQLLSLHTVQCRHHPDAFLFRFFLCLFCLFCWKLHRHCKGSHRTPSLPPVASSLFGFFLHSMHFFRHIYNLCYSWCLSVLHSCNYIYFWCSSTWQTCLMCTIFS